MFSVFSVAQLFCVAGAVVGGGADDGADVGAVRSYTRRRTVIRLRQVQWSRTENRSSPARLHAWPRRCRTGSSSVTGCFGVKLSQTIRRWRRDVAFASF